MHWKWAKAKRVGVTLTLRRRAGERRSQEKKRSFFPKDYDLKKFLNLILPTQSERYFVHSVHSRVQEYNNHLISFIHVCTVCQRHPVLEMMWALLKD